MLARNTNITALPCDKYKKYELVIPAAGVVTYNLFADLCITYNVTTVTIREISIELSKVGGDWNLGNFQIYSAGVWGDILSLNNGVPISISDIEARQIRVTTFFVATTLNLWVAGR